MSTNNQRTSMQQRLNFLLEALPNADNCKLVDEILDSALEILYGGLRVLPTQSAEDPELIALTTKIHETICDNEQRFADILKRYALEGACKDRAGRALDLGLFIEQMSEVATAIGNITSECPTDQELPSDFCDSLQPILNEDTGLENPIKDGDTSFLKRAYSVKLRSPRTARWQSCLEEEMVVTDPIPMGQCVVVLKEFRGLMIRLHLERIIVVTDPWVSTFGMPRGTRVPVWRLEWIFAEYVKQWNLCNDKGLIKTTVTQKVNQDHPINWFWRYYGNKC